MRQLRGGKRIKEEVDRERSVMKNQKELKVMRNRRKRDGVSRSEKASSVSDVEASTVSHSGNYWHETRRSHKSANQYYL